MEQKRNRFGVDAETDSDQKREERGKTKGPTGKPQRGSKKIDVGAKYNRSKIVTSKFDPRFSVSPLRVLTQGDVRLGADNSPSEHLPKPDADAPEFDAGKGRVAPEPYSAVGDDGAPSSNDVSGPDADGGAERAGDFSPGKGTDLDPRDAGASSVAKYVSKITGYWRRGIEACLSIACLCAEASERLTPGQKSDLIRSLPFGNTAFSKFCQIGADTRLNAPEIRVLLPPRQKPGGR